VRAIERAAQFRAHADLGAWLRRILHILAVDRADVQDARWISKRLRRIGGTTARIHN
jgi:DNA-directed RNA polymerase specialized sigma24 family protein